MPQLIGARSCRRALQVSLLAAANLPEDSTQPGSATVVSGQPFTIPTAMGALAPPRSAPPQQHRGLAPGAIAGIVIGSVAGAALLAAAAVFGYKKTKRHRCGAVGLIYQRIVEV
jgi:hypothetical protein